MPNFTYYSLGAQKKLNEIVMAGSHDAGINVGGETARTQTYDIYQQAVCGIRIFDIRIAGDTVGKTGHSVVGNRSLVELKSYHGKGLEFNKKAAVNTSTSTGMTMQTKNMTLGNFGLTLTKILKDADQFVKENATEFLLLKFDHCISWPAIAQACHVLLSDTIYKWGGNLNLKTLEQLKGKVIVLFQPSGLEQARTQAQSDVSRGVATEDYTQYILPIRNLVGKPDAKNAKERPGAYEHMYSGLQYCGKGGTSAFKLTSAKTKLKENIKNQIKRLGVGAQYTNPRVMGMMYWTTTGVKGSIKERNDIIWSEENEDKLVELFELRVPRNVDLTAVSSAGTLKEFMPNFVMIDFADPGKCEKIFSLNFLNAMRINNVMVSAANRHDRG